MRHHEFIIELRHPAPRLWALFQRYDLWKEYALAGKNEQSMGGATDWLDRHPDFWLDLVASEK